MRVEPSVTRMPSTSTPGAGPSGRDPQFEEIQNVTVGVHSLSPAAMKELQNDKLPRKSKLAPVFDHTDPSSLISWLEQVEEIFLRLGIKEGPSKIFLATDWMTYETKKRVESYPETKSGNWATFKDVLKQNFPESSLEEGGSLMKLGKLNSEYAYIPLQNFDKFFKFKRLFEYEYKKVAKPPAVIFNLEAVTLFGRSLEPAFWEKVKDRLEKTYVSNPDAPRRREDKYPIEDVIAATAHICENNMDDGFAVVGMSLSSDSKKERSGYPLYNVKQEDFTSKNEFERKIADTMDRHEIALKQVQSRFEGNQSTLISQVQKVLADTLGGTSGMNVPQMQSISMGPSRMNRFANQQGPAEYSCYFCGEKGHIATNCPHQKVHFEKRYLVRNARGMIVRTERMG